MSKEEVLRKHHDLYMNTLSEKEKRNWRSFESALTDPAIKMIWDAMQECADLQTAAKDKEIAELVKTLKKIKDECLDMKSWKLCKKALRRHIS